VTESPDLRISDADREQALSALGEHMSVGRLTVDEYGERSAKVAAARTQSELQEVFTDLPEPHPRANTPWATVAQSTAKAPATWADRPLGQRMLTAIIPLLFVGAVILVATTHLWFIILVPVLVTAVGRGLWGYDGRGDRDRHERMRDRRRDRRRGLRDR